MNLTAVDGDISLGLFGTVDVFQFKSYLCMVMIVGPKVDTNKFIRKLFVRLFPYEMRCSG